LSGDVISKLIKLAIDLGGNEMKMFARAAALAGVCAALLAAGAMASSADTLIRWTEGSPDRGARAEAYHWFADTVTKRTNGEV
jgi:TRAP-type C4-dicarboxylate transport system substrate-binding protein